MKRISPFTLILYVFITAPILALWQGFVLTQLWAWFIVPFGIKEIALVQAMGLCCISELFLTPIAVKFSLVKTNIDPENEYALVSGLLTSFLMGIILPLVTLICGAIYHYFL